MHGRTVRGPVQILKELWTGETDGTEMKTSYQYGLESRERLANTMKIAKEELLKSRKKTKRCMTEEPRRGENSKKATRYYCYCRWTQTSF